MARRKRSQAPQPQPPYSQIMAGFGDQSHTLATRVQRLFGTADFSSRSWARDVRAMSRAYLAAVRVLLAIDPPAEYDERHRGLIIQSRHMADGLETLAALVVEPEEAASFDLERSRQVLGELTRAALAMRVTLNGLTRDFELATVVAEAEDVVKSVQPTDGLDA